MELAYYAAPRRKNVTLLGVTSAGLSAALVLLPIVGLLASAAISRLINVKSMMPLCDTMSQAVLFVLGTFIFVFPLLGLIVGIAGFIQSRRQCELSAATSLFNVTILLTILAAGF